MTKSPNNKHTLEELMKELSEELRTRQGCHTIILYGSWARGDATETSDYDILAIRESGETVRDARPWKGSYLDLFIYPESKFAELNDQLPDLRAAKILFQKGEFGSQLLSRLNEFYAAGPKRLRADEIQAIRVWYEKVLARIRVGDIQGNLRRAELLPAILEHFFTTRGEWYCGSKAAFRWLKDNRPELYSAFEAALEPGAPVATIEQLVAMVDAAIAAKAKPA